MPKRLLLFLFVIVFLVVIALFWSGQKKAAAPTINNFEQCAQAGYSVMESYPRQCQTPDGRNFVEILVPEK